MTHLPELLEMTMRDHEHEAPEGDVIAHRVRVHIDNQSNSRLRSRRWSTVLTAGLASGAVVVVVASALALAGGDSESVNDPTSAPPSNSQASKPPLTAVSAVLDPLSYRLVLGTLRPDGEMTSRIRVENHSGAPVTDPGCRWSANFSYGVVPVDQPNAKLYGRVITKCSGAKDLPDGFVGSAGGPTFILRGLPPGAYLAIIDFGDARSERLAKSFRVP
jgi:hypothetical protein